MDNKKLISIVVPVYNESENIFPFYLALTKIIEDLPKYDFEVIFTDNHSHDDTFEKVLEICNKDSRVRIVRFSKNFGYQKSILAGYLNSRGDAVVQLDCDLQDPLELIPSFIDLWNNGYKVVYGIRKSRDESIITHSIRRIFYRLINLLSDDPLPLDAGDFRLIDKKIIEVLKETDDSQPYLRGYIATMGFKQIGIPYDRNKRQRGMSKFRAKDLFLLAFDGILNHSIIPLRLASFFGIFISCLTIVLIIIYSLGKLYFDLSWPPGFTTLTVISLFGISINSLFLGIIGEYVGRIYQQVKKKPLTIIEKVGGTYNQKT